MKKFTKLGILGGMGPSATLNLYRALVDGRGAVSDQQHINMVVLNDSTIPDRTAAILRGGESPLPYIIADCKRLSDAGCDVIAIPCNTSHYFYRQIAEASPIPVLNMLEITADVLVNDQVKTTYLLATSGTISTGIYKKAIESRKITFVDPAESEIELMMQVIYDIKAGKTPPLREYFALIERCVSRRCDKIVLGCTELSLIAPPESLAPYLVDSSQCLAEKILELF